MVIKSRGLLIRRKLRNLILRMMIHLPRNRLFNTKPFSIENQSLSAAGLWSKRLTLTKWLRRALTMEIIALRRIHLDTCTTENNAMKLVLLGSVRQPTLSLSTCPMISTLAKMRILTLTCKIWQKKMHHRKQLMNLIKGVSWLVIQIKHLI